VDAERARDNHIAPHFTDAIIRPLMQIRPFDGEDIITPCLFQMNQSGSPLAKDKVLQSGNRQKIVFGIVHWY
jgi:hypothetical protein